MPFHNSTKQRRPWPPTCSLRGRSHGLHVTSNDTSFLLQWYKRGREGSGQDPWETRDYHNDHENAKYQQDSNANEVERIMSVTGGRGAFGCGLCTLITFLLITTLLTYAAVFTIGRGCVTFSRRGLTMDCTSAVTRGNSNCGTCACALSSGDSGCNSFVHGGCVCPVVCPNCSRSVSDGRFGRLGGGNCSASGCGSSTASGSSNALSNGLTSRVCPCCIRLVGACN